MNNESHKAVLGRVDIPLLSSVWNVITQIETAFFCRRLCWQTRTGFVPVLCVSTRTVSTRTQSVAIHPQKCLKQICAEFQ